jgi:hypothetical protein
MKAAKLLLLAPFALGVACATLAGSGQGDVDLPSNLVGPFRSLKRGKTCDGDTCTGVDELPDGTTNGIAKYPQAPPSRAPAVMRLGEGGDLHLAIYAARDLDANLDTIVRMESPDARTFASSDVTTVLGADQPWEGGAIGDPWVLRDGADVWLYYDVHATNEPGQTPGIARARATDGAGLAFSKDGLVTIDGSKGGWETEPPRAPSVVRDDAGVYHLFYASGTSIGEATSADGLHFTRVGTSAVLVPSTAPTVPLPEGEKPPFDDLAVDDPCVERAITPAGEVHWRVLYTGRDVAGASAIGFAARYGDAGALSRNPGSVFSTKLHANAPALARFDAFTLLYPMQDVNMNEPKFDPLKQAIGVAISPERTYLPIAE